MISWILAPDEYVRNLNTVARICADLGLTITYVLWARSNEYFQILEAIMHDAVGANRPVGIQSRARSLWQFATDYITAKKPVPAGTHFQYKGYPEPDVKMLEQGFSGGSANWKALFPNITGFAYLTHTKRPRDLQHLVEQYLEAVDDVFTSPAARGVLLSYDLYNELETALKGKQVQDPIYRGAFDFIAFTHRHLQRHRVRRRFGLPLNVTMGNAGINRLEEFYKQLLQRGSRMSYVSFHLYGDGVPYIHRKQRWTQSARWLDYLTRARSIASRLSTITRDIVCSEFYAPWQQHALASRGNLLPITDALRQAKAGGQIWSVLETNFFVSDTKDVPRPFPVGTPFDGLFVPHDPPFGVNSTFEVPKVLKNSVFLGDERDRQALIGWTGGRLPPVSK